MQANALRTFWRFASLSVLVLGVLGLAACGNTASADNAKPYRVAVFVPGMLEGSPTYEMMAAGAEAAKAALATQGRKLEIKVVEAGFNQAEWQKTLFSVAATAEYDLIVSSNPSLPELAAAVAKELPAQKFLITDAFLEGNPAIATIAFDHYQQGYLNGWWAARLSSSKLPNANPERVLALVAGQEYPVMNEQILVGFQAGAKAVDPGFKVEFRVLGNWYDAAKAEALATDLIAAKADVILAIAGGANQGVIKAARDKGAYVSTFDSAGFSLAPGIVMDSTMIQLDVFCRDAIIQAAEGKLAFGSAVKLGVAEDAVRFCLDDPALPADLPADLVVAARDLVAKIKDGSLVVKP